MNYIVRLFSGLKQKFIVKKMRAQNGDISVYMFHNITNSTNEVVDDYSISKDSFIKFIDYLQNEKIEICSLDDCLVKERAIAITFDDVYESAYLKAFPVLEEKKIPYTVFVTQCYVGQDGYITKSQLQTLINSSNCTVGFHAQEHKLMRGLTNTEINQITNPTLFENLYHIKCEYFAFPYGSIYACPKRAVIIAANHQYKAIFSTICSSISSKKIDQYRYFLPRINVNEDNWIKILHKRKKQYENY